MVVKVGVKITENILNELVVVVEFELMAVVLVGVVMDDVVVTKIKCIYLICLDDTGYDHCTPFCLDERKNSSV